MPTTTTDINAYLGASGLAGTAGVVVYAADGSTVYLAHTTSGITELGATGNYQKLGITVSFDTIYKVIWDDGAGNYSKMEILYLPTGVNVITVNDVPVRDGNGVAVAVTTTTIDLDTTDPYRAANLVGWTVEVINATTGAGQVATITASGITSPFRQTFAAWTLPTGAVRYKLTPPAAAGSNADVLAVLGTPSGASVSVDLAALPAAATTAWWAKTGMLGDGAKTAQQTLTKAVGRMFGKIDTITIPGTAIFRKADDSGEAFRETFSGTGPTSSRGNHTPGSGL